MASPPPPIKHFPRAAQSDDVLRHIFLFLDSPADLARACAASPTFRRIITDPRFLRRFRALHRPPLLGIVSCNVFHPAEPPHPSAAAAQAFVNGGGTVEFYCEFFLPFPGPWHPWHYRDTLDGLRLFYAEHVGSHAYSHYELARRIAVCDPLHNRYRILPAIPEDLAALVGAEQDDVYAPYASLFLAPRAEDDEEKDDSLIIHHSRHHNDDHQDNDDSSSLPFRVMSLMHCVGKLVVLFVFSSSGAGGKWHAVTFDNWSVVSNFYAGCPSLLRRYHYMHGRFCWPIMPFEKKLLVLDARQTMPELSTVNLPSYVRSLALSNRAVFVEATGGEQGRIAVFTIHKHEEHDVHHLLYAVQRDNDGDQWEPEAIIYLPLLYHDYHFRGVEGGYLLLEGKPEGWNNVMIKHPDYAVFSLDLQTLELQWFCGKKSSFIEGDPYVGFPLYLSPPTV